MRPVRGCSRCFDACCRANELCQLVRFEWRADRRDMLLDGRHWREVFGGRIGNAGQKMGASACCGPKTYVMFRLLAFATAAAVLGLRLYYASDGWFWFLYFNHLVTCLATLYFGLAMVLTTVATCTDGYESTGAPFFVQVTSVVYAALVPAALVNVVSSGLVFYHYGSLFSVDTADGITDVGTTLGIFLVTMADLVVNRQPYYATFHALIGILFTWGYLLFTIVYYYAGGTDSYGHAYIYEYLNWGTPLRGGGGVTGGKTILINFFVIFPCLNLLYWALVWVRRRVLVSSKPFHAAV